MHASLTMVELLHSVISDISDQRPFIDFGVNGVQTVSSRPMVVCRPIDCTCVCRTQKIVRGNFVYIQNFNSLAIYIIFNRYVMLSYAVFSVLDNGVAKRTFATVLPLMQVACVGCADILVTNNLADGLGDIWAV